MPREQINYPHKPLDLEPVPAPAPISADGSTSTMLLDGSDSVPLDQTLHVGWNNAGWVQISLEADPRYFRFVQEHPDGEDGRTTAYTEVLSRHEINKLIKVLRRARDAAYGRDE